jgi:transcriptional regulator with XRE-family HTH domain
MTFAQKLSKLTAGRNKSAISQAADLPATAISNYINRKYTPSADKALRIARALDVPLDWLVDPDRDLPAPKSTGTLDAGALSDEQLMREVSRRYRIRATALWNALAEIDSINWEDVARKLLSVPLDVAFSPQLQHFVRLIETTGNEPFGLADYDASFTAEMYNGMPGEDLPEGQLRREQLMDRLYKVRRSRGFAIANKCLMLRYSTNNFPHKSAGLESWRDDLLRELPSATASKTSKGKANKPNKF